MDFINILQHIGSKITSIFTSLGGWCISIGLAFVNYIGDEKLAFSGVAFAVLVDMIWGIAASVKRKRFILSYLLRETFVKVGIYASCLLLILTIERGLHDGWFVVTKTACAVAAACEVWSIFANILIVKPDCIFIRIFKRQLAGEMKKKLDIEWEEGRYNETQY